MSINICDLSYHYSNQPQLFSGLSFSVSEKEKVSVVGNNGTGKSTLLKLIAGILNPGSGVITCSSKPYYIPQHDATGDLTVSGALGVEAKLKALDSIIKGSMSQKDYDILDNDWDLEARCESAFAYWNLPPVDYYTPMERLSGGEQTKVFLAGLLIHAPHIVLLDEPSNDLDKKGRELLYQYIDQSSATIVVVSHDRTLLERLPVTYEFFGEQLKRYGGNYSFYEEQKAIETNALAEAITEAEKQFRLARKKAQEVRERQERRISKSKRQSGGIPRIAVKNLLNASENTASRLKEKHLGIVENNRDKLTELKQQKGKTNELKLDFADTSLHSGKLLVETRQVNFSYHDGSLIWQQPLDIKLFSNDRIQIEGDNGTGKTTLIKIVTGFLGPVSGYIKRAEFSWIYLDQDYTMATVDCTVAQLAASYNRSNMEEHEVKLRLNRFLFPADTWDKKCTNLSEGEKMRLILCCLMISNNTPDLIVLDEPTNNLDIASLNILTRTIRNYKGSLLIVSHDLRFIDEIGITGTINLNSYA